MEKIKRNIRETNQVSPSPSYRNNLIVLISDTKSGEVAVAKLEESDS